MPPIGPNFGLDIEELSLAAIELVDERDTELLLAAAEEPPPGTMGPERSLMSLGSTFLRRGLLGSAIDLSNSERSAPGPPKPPIMGGGGGGGPPPPNRADGGGGGGAGGPGILLSLYSSSFCFFFFLFNLSLFYSILFFLFHN